VKPPPAAKYNRTVTLQTPPATETFDTFSQPVPNWTTVGTYSAAIRPLNGREAAIARQVKAQASHAIEMRYNPTLTMNPLDQLLYVKLGVTRTFGIVQVLNIEEANIEFYIIAEEILQQNMQV
jgi:SPP1 family predicted phage head-tail adaptor